MGAEAVLDRARELGVALRLLDGARLECRSSSPIPSDLLEELRLHKAEVLDYLRQKAPVSEFEPWVLAEWRRVSRPQWRNVLRESIAKGDKEREEYARWMLTEVLIDPERRDGAGR